MLYFKEDGIYSKVEFLTNNEVCISPEFLDEDYTINEDGTVHFSIRACFTFGWVVNLKDKNLHGRRIESNETI